MIALALTKDQAGCVVLHSLQTAQFRIWKASEQGVTAVHLGQHKGRDEFLRGIGRPVRTSASDLAEFE